MGIIDGIVGCPRRLYVIHPLQAWWHMKGEWCIRYPSPIRLTQLVREKRMDLSLLSAV